MEFGKRLGILVIISLPRRINRSLSPATCVSEGKAGRPNLRGPCRDSSTHQIVDCRFLLLPRCRSFFQAFPLQRENSHPASDVVGLGFSCGGLLILHPSPLYRRHLSLTTVACCLCFMFPRSRRLTRGRPPLYRRTKTADSDRLLKQSTESTQD